MALTDSVRSAQDPDAPGTWAWPPRAPSLPTSRATRVTSDVTEESWSTMPLKTVAISPSRPSDWWGSRVPKSPSRTAVSPARSSLSSGSPTASLPAPSAVPRAGCGFLTGASVIVQPRSVNGTVGVRRKSGED